VLNYLSAETVSKSFHDRWLFRGISLGISQGEKFALVGRNGEGKTTLLKILSGELETDEGTVVFREGITVGLLSQQPIVDEQAEIKDLLFSEDNKIAAVVKEYEDAIRHDTTPERMQELLDKMEELNAWGYESKVQEVIAKLGVPELEARFATLSGGQKKRILLARLLLQEPDLLIMDEPTNHLDLTAIEWLENYLSGTNITLIMVTHDRYFLDKVATEIFELDSGRLFRYEGNYAYFLEKKSAREEIQQAEVAKARNLLKKELEWMRRQPKARGTKAKYRVDAFNELKEKASKDLRKKNLELEIKETRQGGKILELVNVTQSYGNLQIIRDFSYVFKKYDRIGVIGPNGVGKSTFLDIITGKVRPASGEVIPGLTTKFGYFTQEDDNMTPGSRLIEEIKSIAEFITLSNGSQVSASRFLEMFLFPPEKQYNFIDKLSGGEMKRLRLLKMLITNPNFLVLDEPTNDFDIDTLNVLEDFLAQFKGCLLLVSHDRYFMDQLVDQLFVFENDMVTLFNGNYSDYRLWLEEQEQLEADIKHVDVPVSTPKVSNKGKLSFREMREYEVLTKEIGILEAEKAATIELLTTGSTDHQKLLEGSSRIQEIDDEINTKMARWLELAEFIS
jgi:ABC transport system ATP-binding/permease protein